MAGKATKKQVQSNLSVLNGLYKVTLPIVVLAFLRTIFLSSDKSWIKFIILHLPMIACIYVVDKSGRPHFDGNGKIVKEGIDLSQGGGLTEYLFDIIYLSLFGDIGRILLNTNKFWYVMLLCPVYIGYKLYGLKNQFMGNSGLSLSGRHKKPEQKPEEPKSKRQLKREKKGDNHVKTKYR